MILGIIMTILLSILGRSNGVETRWARVLLWEITAKAGKEHCRAQVGRGVWTIQQAHDRHLGAIRTYRREAATRPNKRV